MRAIFLLGILPVILAEAHLVGPWIAERLLRWGTGWLPEEYQERYVADWLGELDAVPGSLFKLGFAIRVLLSVPATHRALTGRDTLWTVIAKRLLALAATGLLMAAMVLLRLRNQVRSNPERAEAFTSSLERALRRRVPVDAQMPDPTQTNRPLLTPDTPLEEVHGMLVEFKSYGDPRQPPARGVFRFGGDLPQPPVRGVISMHAPPELLGVEIDKTLYEAVEALSRNPEEDWPELGPP